MINLIAAVSDNNVIGVNDTIPWRLKADMQYFKKVTMDNVVVMGRNTYNSLFSFMKNKDAEPLPGRLKCVISHDKSIANFKNNIIVLEIGDTQDFYETIMWMEKHFLNRDIFISGGTQIYSMFSGYYDDLYITRVHKTVQVDEKQHKVFQFPISQSVLLHDYDLLYSDTKQADEDNECNYTFQQWRLKSKM